MTQQLYKVRLPYDAVDKPSHSSKAMLRFDCFYHAIEIRDKAVKYLNDNGKWDHFVNWYDNTDVEADKYEVVFVLSDRDTALLLKLAMQ